MDIIQSILNGLNVGRVVTFLTPIVFAPLAGFIVLWAAKVGVNFDVQGALDVILQVATFLVGAVIAYLKSAQWLKGRRAWEDNMEKRETDLSLAHTYKSYPVDERLVDQDAAELPHLPLGMKDQLEL